MIKRLVILLAMLLIPLTGYAAGPTFTGGFTSNGPTNINGGINQLGSLNIDAIADPSAPSVTVNTIGAVTATYYIVGHDGAETCGSGEEGVSKISPGTVVTTNAVPPNTTITLPMTTGYLFYDVLKNATNTSLATCVVPGSTVVDTGQSLVAYIAPTRNSTGDIRGIVNLSNFSTNTITATGTTPTIGQFSVNGVLNAQAYGAVGDAIYSGDGVRVADGTTNGTTTFTSPTGGFTSALVGDDIFIDGAGAAAGEYLGLVSSVTNATTIVLSSTPATNVTGTAHYVIGFDNTTVLQAWINAMRTAAGTGRSPEGYLPVGTYLHRGLDFTEWANFKLTGAQGTLAPSSGGEGGSSFLCIAPTTSPKVCHDFSGVDLDTVRDLGFVMGTTDAEAGKVNVQIARISTSFFGTMNNWDSNVLRAQGGTSSYDLVLYGAEQTNLTNNMINSNVDTANALYISGANTPSFTSPTRGSLITAPTSMTSVTISGMKTQISSNGNPAVTLDGTLSDITISGVYGQLHGSTDAFIKDTASSSIGNLTLTGNRVEAQGAAGEVFLSIAGTLNFANITGDSFQYSGATNGSSSAISINAGNDDNFTNFAVNNTIHSPEISITSGADNYASGIVHSYFSAPSDGNQTHTYTGSLLADSGVGTPPQHLALFPSCAAGTEGLSGTQDNSTAACSAGTTATSAGTTHCQIYCNGTNWVQTGR